MGPVRTTKHSKGTKPSRVARGPHGAVDAIGGAEGTGYGSTESTGYRAAGSQNHSVLSYLRGLLFAPV